MTEPIGELRIEPISKLHNRKDFECEEYSLNVYIQKHARQNDEKNIARCFVAVNDKDAVFGYFTLSTSSIEFEELPDEYVKRLPRYPVPAALIGKLAVDSNAGGQGLGARLLVDALQRILDTSEKMAIKIVLVDAIDEKAKGFYLHYGFIELPGHDLTLFLPIETIEQLLAVDE